MTMPAPRSALTELQLTVKLQALQAATVKAELEAIHARAHVAVLTNGAATRRHTLARIRVIFILVLAALASTLLLTAAVFGPVLLL